MGEGVVEGSRQAAGGGRPKYFTKDELEEKLNNRQIKRDE